MKMLDVKTLESENPPVARSPVKQRDTIDEKLEVWVREIPDLDVRTEGIVDRVGVIQKFLRRTHDETLEQFGLNWGETKVLSSLRYGGPPYRSTPGRLGSQLDLSSGAMTARLDKMEEANLIRRLPDPDDRRGVVIELTEHGRELWEQSIAVQAEKESTVAAALTAAEQDQLNALLRRLVIAFTDEHGPLSKRRRPDAASSEYDPAMSSLEQVSQPSVAVTRDRSRAIFGQTMGLVALTCAVAALGAYLGRDISRGWGILAFIGAIACIIGLNAAIQRSEQLAIGLLFGLGAFMGSPQRRCSPTTPRSTRRRSGRQAPAPRSSSAASVPTAMPRGATSRRSPASRSSRCSG